jgi:hypothetical protein
MKGRALEEIPGVGPKLAQALRDLGLRCADDLAGQDPDGLYRRLIALRACPIDRCVLYVFRCAVYYAENGRAGAPASGIGVPLLDRCRQRSQASVDGSSRRRSSSARRRGTFRPVMRSLSTPATR